MKAALHGTEIDARDLGDLLVALSLQLPQPEDQAMIRSNRIDRGFDSTQVYLSFGNADRTEVGETQSESTRS